MTELKENKIYEGERVGIISLGCSRNVVDSEKILADARSRGARICPVEKAGTVLVNTCAFTKEAKQESIDVILDLIDLKKRGKIKKIVVHGCLAQRYPRELKQNFGEVDGFAGISGFKEFYDSSARITPSHFAYLKISEGCANFCSYCAIPKIKGSLRSRDEGSILKEAQLLEKDGCVELNIIGQDITLYGQEGAAAARSKGAKLTGCSPLAALLKKILRSTDIPWIRLLYLHPLRVSEELLTLMAREKRICPYVDMPLQHVNDRILKMMNRGINKEGIRAAIERVRARVPQAALRTTFIAGFPSETEKEFRELLDFVRQTRFERLGVFLFSAEEGTPAYSFKKQLSEKIRQRRFDALMSLQREISRGILKEEVGKVLDVMVDEDEVARTRKDAPEVDGVVFLNTKRKLARGSIVKARIIDVYEYDLVGRPLS